MQRVSARVYQMIFAIRISCVALVVLQ